MVVKPTSVAGSSDQSGRTSMCNGLHSFALDINKDSDDDVHGVVKLSEGGNIAMDDKNATNMLNDDSEYNINILHYVFLYTYHF